MNKKIKDKSAAKKLLHLFIVLNIIPTLFIFTIGVIGINHMYQNYSTAYTYAIVENINSTLERNLVYIESNINTCDCAVDDDQEINKDKFNQKFGSIEGIENAFYLNNKFEITDSFLPFDDNKSFIVDYENLEPNTMYYFLNPENVNTIFYGITKINNNDYLIIEFDLNKMVSFKTVKGKMIPLVHYKTLYIELSQNRLENYSHNKVQQSIEINNFIDETYVVLTLTDHNNLFFIVLIITLICLIFYIGIALYLIGRFVYRYLFYYTNDLATHIGAFDFDNVSEHNELFVIGDYPHELKKLVNNINIMTNKIIKSFKHNNQILGDTLTQLEKANYSKSIFLANMSHEMRTPLNAIIGYIQLLNSNPKLNEKEKANYLEIISISSELLLRRINDVLDVSKIESGEITLEENSVNVNDLFNEIHNVLKGLLLDKDINLLSKVDKNIPQIIIDEERIKQVLLILCNNAIKFTEVGYVKFSAELIKRYEDSVDIIFSVSDTGKGISSENIDKIFLAFNQEDNTIKRKYGGTGLGLSIGKKLIEKMGGEITVLSTLGKGTTFNVVLNCKLKNGSDNNEIICIEKLSDETISDLLIDKKILVAEDNEINQDLLIELFKLFNYHDLVIKNNGLSAVKELKENSDYDIVFMDVQMPILDGIEATKKIRGDLKLKDIPIIALTANAYDDQRKYYLEIGMNDHLSKPINVQKLKNILVAYLLDN